MKILFIYENIARWGGVERIWVDKINWFVQKGINVKLITTTQGNHPIPYEINSKAIIKDLHIQFHYSYRYRGIRKLWDQRCRQKKFKRLFAQELKEYKPDIIVCVATLYVPTLVKLKGNIPLIAESHDICINTYQSFAHPLIQKIQKRQLFKSLAKVDCIVSLTEGDAKEWHKHNKNIVVIPNTVHLNPTGQISNNTQKHVIFVGRITELKGIPLLLEIWQKVTKVHPDWILDIYGEIESNNLKALIDSQAQISKNIIHHQPTKNIFEKFCNSSICVLTSKYESFGLVLPEAMSCGLPVVSFDSPYGPADIITDGVDGFLVPLGDTNIFANKVCQLIENPEMRKKMGATGIKSSQRYAAENIMPQWIKLFNKITSSKT